MTAHRCNEGPCPLQRASADRLRRLHHLRRDLDGWNAAGGASPMPQPSNYDLRLQPLLPSEIFWPMESRP